MLHQSAARYLVLVQSLLKIIFYDVRFSCALKQILPFHNPLTYGPVGHNIPIQHWINLPLKVFGFYFLSILLSFSKSNFLRSQLAAGISTSATYYSFLPDMPLYVINYVKLTLIIFLISLIFSIFQESKHFLETSQWIHVSYKGSHNWYQGLTLYSECGR